MKKKKRALSLEILEDRCTPAAWNNPWPEPGNLTISFAPDGTSLGGAPSALYSHLGQTMSPAVWQAQILRAFQSWAEQANIDFSLVADDGKAFGALGGGQGVAGHGDMRIGAASLSPAELAVSQPFDLLSEWSGDVTINTNYLLGVGDAPGQRDLFTVMLQEAGHTLSIGNSTVAASAQYEQYLGARTGLGAVDIASIQGLYGKRSADRFDAKESNGTKDKATELAFVSDTKLFGDTDETEGDHPFVAEGDLTTRSDVDFYTIKTPKGQTAFSVDLRTSGVSLLTARVTVYDSSMKQVAAAVATDPGNGDLSLSITGAKADAAYYVKVEAAKQDVFAVGKYRLAIGTDSRAAVAPKDRSAFVNDDTKGVATAVVGMTGKKAVADSSWDATYRASISTVGDTDSFKVKAPAGTQALVVAVWATEAGGLDPMVTVYAGKGTVPVEAEVIYTQRGYLAIQVRGAVAGTDYTFKVEARDAKGNASSRGNYFLAVDFRAEAFELTRFLGGTLSDAAPQQVFSLRNDRAQLFHFRLAADEGSLDAAVRVTIYDAAQQPVLSFMSQAGQTTSADILLAPATYTVRIVGGMRTGLPLDPLAFTLDGLARNDPIGPEAVNPTAAPTAPAPLAPASTTTTAKGTTYAYTTATVYAPPTYPDYSLVYQGMSLAWMKPTDPYASAWMAY
ncbi:MAG: matrixin family metalloprotease [Gemmataceae bacterium]|nr:matrixin family metalloprotease [Gemmataceae bacterium]